MRVLLDCRYLPGSSQRAEKCLFIHRVAAILSKDEEVEWLFLVDRDYPDTFGGIGQSMPVAGIGTLWLGEWLWRYWHLPRIIKKIKPHRVMKAEQLEGIPGAGELACRPLSGEEKEEVKQRYAQGKEYFLADVGGMRKEQIVALLKAFSLFKKRQRSNMGFVLWVGAVRGRGKGIPIDLENYKYRSDVLVVDDAGEGEWRRLLGAAYVLVASAAISGFSSFNAWKMETPVISGVASSQGMGAHWPGQDPIGEDAVLRYQPGDPASLAALLMSLFTNERLRAEWIGKGRDRLLLYSWERSAGQVWEMIIAGGK
jgi:glycosyltransferase involved in cell wall biosynthesis